VPAAPPSETDFEGLLRALAGAGVEFIVVGGVAGKGTTRGDLDLLGEVVGGGGYEALLPHSQALEMFGLRCLCLELDKLIEVKRAAGRPKDLEAIAELETIREERRKRGL